MATNELRFDFVARNRASGTFDQLSRESEGLSGKLGKLGAAMKGVGLGGAAISGGLGVAITKAASFDKTIRQVAVVTGESAEAMKGLSDLALKMGADTVFSAADASQAMLELAKGGMTAATIQGGALQATMTLAAAGELEMADAATYVANSLQMFGLEAKDANRVTTALAGGANASSASVESLGLALSQVGPGAKLAGASIEETVGVLSAFDAAGVKGSDAGTSFKTMLSRLVPQTDKAAGTMEELGLSFTDAQGEFRPMREIAEQLQVALGKLTPEMRSTALTTIFGSDAFRAAAIMADLGAEGVDKYTAAAKNQKAAQDLANAGMEGAAGAIENFKGSIETLSIKLGTGLLPAFTAILNGINNDVLPAIDVAIGEVGELFAGIDLGGLKERVTGAFDDAFGDVDFGGLAERARDGGASAVQPLIDSFTVGMRNGEWGPFGTALGEGLVKALEGGVTVAAGLGGVVKDWIGQVDWWDVGSAVGTEAPAFALAFTSALFGGLWKVIKERPIHALLALASIIPVGKAISIFKPLRNFIEKLPLGSWITTAADRAAAPVFDAAVRFVGRIGSGISQGLQRVFPGLTGKGGVLLSKLDTIRTTLFVWWDDARQKVASVGMGFPIELGKGIGAGLGWAVRAAGRLIGAIVSPFARAGMWLIRPGINAVTGLVRGVLDTIGHVRFGIGQAVGAVRTGFASSGTLLVGAGRNLLIGLRSGIAGGMRGMGRWLKGQVVDPIISAVKGFFGIKSPSRVFAGIGGHLVGGLLQGMMRANPGAIVGKVFGGMPQALGALVSKGLISVTSLPGKALSALSGLGGAFAGMLDGVSGGAIGGFVGGGGASQKTLVSFGRWLQSMGYSVTEHPAFGGVAPVHVKGSAHYRGEAIDVNKGAGTSRAEQAALAQIIGPARQAGLRSLFMVPGHYNHAHIAMATGGVIAEPVVGIGARSGRSYSFGERGPETVLPGVPRRMAAADYGRVGGAATTVRVEQHYHFPNYVGTHSELRRALKDLDRTRHLDFLRR